jgi:integrase
MAQADLYNLHKVGRVYHCDFMVKGIRVHRSTRKAMIADATVEAKRWYDEALDKANGVKPPAMAPSLGKAMKEWEDANRGVLSDKHVDGTIDKLNLHFADLMDTSIEELDAKTVQAKRQEYLIKPGPTGRKHKPGGANSLIMALNTVLGWHVEAKTISAKPFKLRKVKVEKVPRRVVPLTDTRAFLAAVDAPYKPSAHKNSPKAKPKNPHVCTAIRLMLGLGLREKEALAARWEWLDKANRTYYAGKTKNGKVRLIPVPRWLLAHLGADTPTQGLIMPCDGGKPHTAQFTAKVLDAVAVDLGLAGLTPHRLRATFATNHAREGTPPTTIQVWLGHEHLETTMIYIEFIDDGGHAAQDRIEERMGLTVQEDRKPGLAPQDFTNTKRNKSANKTKKTS